MAVTMGAHARLFVCVLLCSCDSALTYVHALGPLPDLACWSDHPATLCEHHEMAMAVALPDPVIDSAVASGGGRSWESEVWPIIKGDFEKLAKQPILSRAEGCTGRTFSAKAESQNSTFTSFIENNKEARGVAGNLAWLEPTKISLLGDRTTMELAEKSRSTNFGTTPQGNPSRRVRGHATRTFR